ncbi:hypothetical protein CBR_g8685 [Chara braunii]|uniref:F-box domain-containing protein n=1 Tax=Chara braunii TaxID=69332 RepID=A0A388KMI0_CHABU|nr:hypothetical protein CBR_g8685 [Chara braunii]|eukprot:GBG71264.1 hypothetical protein CBR_g8685 [Chara braunii]
MGSTMSIEKEGNKEDVFPRREGDPTRDQQTDQRPDYLPALAPETGEDFLKNDAAESESAGVERETEGVFLESDAERDVANAEEKGGSFLSERSDTETSSQHSDDSTHRPCTYHDHEHPPYACHQQCNLEDKRADDVEVGHDWGDLEHDALVLIFSFLSYVQQRIRVGAVCKSWHRASLDPGCWKEPDARLWFGVGAWHSTSWQSASWRIASCKSAARTAVIRAQGQLISLSTWDCDPDVLDLIGRNCPLLERLDLLVLSLHRPRIKAVDAIVNGCQGLRELSITMACDACDAPYHHAEEKSPAFASFLLFPS